MNEERLMEELQQMMGYRFRDKRYLYRALSHSSFANENRSNKYGVKGSNERLEFLGDSVLSLVVAEHIFKNFRHIPEGELTKLRASLVCESTLYEFSKKIKLGEHIFVGRGEEQTGGRTRPSIVSDAFEAVIAAVYLDGGLEAARSYVLSFLPHDLAPLGGKQLHDYKTELQEVIQRNPEEKVEYFLKGESGPDHDKKFTVQVKLNSNVIGEGIGRSKKAAEQAAAREALRLMGIEK